MTNIELILETLKNSRTDPQDYPNSKTIIKNLIPVFNHSIACEQHGQLVKLILQELSINDASKDPHDEEIKVLAKLSGHGSVNDQAIEAIHHEVAAYRALIEEIVRSLSLEGPGVCVLENVFSESYMDKFRAWVDQYLEQEMNKKEHFAFGTNKTIFRVPEKLPSDLLYSYLQFDAGSEDHKTPAFNHVIDR